MSEHELRPDAKGEASLRFGEVIRQTKDNYPDPRFRPQVFEETQYYTIAAIDPKPYYFWSTGDGTGTKPEIGERLFSTDLSPDNFETLAFDDFAMVESDEARFGRFMVGIVNTLDMNTADDEVVSALSKGAKNACDTGRFALLNGETAELGYRTSGYGKTRVNWNAVGISIVNPEKLILGKELAPEQLVVALREKTLRSNGFTRARNIAELSYLLKETPFKSKEEYIGMRLRELGINVDENLEKEEEKNLHAINSISELMKHDFTEQVLLPWHEVNADLARKLLMPSQLYGPIIYDAQGGVDGERNVQMISAAHISGGGVPEKGTRMVKAKGLGLSLDAPFPDPEAVEMLMDLNSENESMGGKSLVNERTASEQWNRGIGFMVVVPDNTEAQKLIEIAASHNVEAAVAGKVIDKPEIQFRGHTWRYAT